MARTVARRRPAVLAVSALRPASAPAGRARPCEGSGPFRADPARTHRSAHPPSRHDVRGAASGDDFVSASTAALPFPRREASHGAQWLREAFAMLWAYRVRWLLLLLAYYFIIVAINLVPWVGAYAAPLLKPIFAVGFLAAAWSQERGQAH